MSTERVKFDVGGVLYTVARSTLNLHPSTMLAKSASDQWQQDAESTIFLDRDGDIFRHVLAYMRDGRVFLPISTITKNALLVELEYFGFDNVDEGTIHIDMEEKTFFIACRVKDRMKDLMDEMKYDEYCATLSQNLLKMAKKECDNLEEENRLKPGDSFTLNVKKHAIPSFLCTPVAVIKNEGDKVPDALISSCNNYLNKAGLSLLSIRLFRYSGAANAANAVATLEVLE